jgi:hypothetical protein
MATTLISLLFPHEARVFPGQRWVNISLRCAHLVGVAGIAGGFLFGLEPEAWASYWHLTLASGIALSLIYVWSTAAWLFELKGLTIILKTMLLALALAVPSLKGEVFIAIIVMSGLIAHAPARVRSRPWLKLPAVGESQ